MDIDIQYLLISVLFLDDFNLTPFSFTILIHSFIVSIPFGRRSGFHIYTYNARSIHFMFMSQHVFQLPLVDSHHDNLCTADIVTNMYPLSQSISSAIENLNKIQKITNIASSIILENFTHMSIDTNIHLHIVSAQTNISMIETTTPKLPPQDTTRFIS